MVSRPTLASARSGSAAVTGAASRSSTRGALRPRTQETTLTHGWPARSAPGSAALPLGPGLPLGPSLPLGPGLSRRRVAGPADDRGDAAHGVAELVGAMRGVAQDQAGRSRGVAVPGQRVHEYAGLVNLARQV